MSAAACHERLFLLIEIAIVEVLSLELLRITSDRRRVPLDGSYLDLKKPQEIDDLVSQLTNIATGAE